VAEHTFIGITRDSRLAREAGFVVGTELRYLGVNANLAPIADIVTTNYDRIRELDHNPTIGVRAFGAHKNIVNEMSIQYMKGLQDGGVLAIAKHFPGHGSSLENPHEVLPNIGIETEPELMNTSMAPFKQLIDEGVNGLLTSHIKVPPWDFKYPVTFSKKIIEEKLRNELGFEGLVVTDDMSIMDGILKSEPSSVRPTGIEIYSRLEAIKMAHQAGHDITIIGVIYPDEKLKENEIVNKLKKNPIARSQLSDIIHELMSLYGDKEGLEFLRYRVRRILFQKALLFGFDNFKNPANWRIHFVEDKYKEMLADHRRTADQILHGSAVLLSEAGQVWDKKEKFRYFGDGRGPLSKNSFLVSEGDKIILASPVHSPPDELYEAVRAKVKRLKDNQIKTVHMVYGYSETDMYLARQKWPGEHIERISLLNPLGNFIFREEDIKREHFPLDEDEPGVEERIKQLKEKARVIDHFIDKKVEQIIVAAEGAKMLIFAIVTRPQIEILERLHARLTEDLPSVYVIVLLFKEPFLVSRSIYENKMITVLNLSAFPDLTKAAELLVGQISPKPAQYSALNAPRTPISITGGADLNPYSVKEIHQAEERAVLKGFVFPELVWTLLVGIIGGIFFYSVLLVSSNIRFRLFNILGNGIIGLAVAVILHFLFPFIKQIVVLGVTIETGRGIYRLVIVFLISFLFNAFWFKFIQGVPPTRPTNDNEQREEQEKAWEMWNAIVRIWPG